MPLLARMLAAPLVVDVRPGAIAGLGDLLTERRITNQGRVAVAVGPGQGESILTELRLGEAEVFRIGDGSHDSATDLGRQLRAGAYEALAGIGGGKTIDVAKFAAHMAGLPMVAVATSLAHDGIASPVSTLRHESGTGSYGVMPPVAIVVDLDRVRCAPAGLSTAGIGDVVSNLSAVADWERCPRQASATRSATCPRSLTGSCRRPTPASRWTGWRWRWPARRPTRCCTSQAPAARTSSSRCWPRR